MGQCSVSIMVGYNLHGCRKKANHRIGMKLYCGVHFPPNVEKREKRMTEKFNADMKERMRPGKELKALKSRLVLAEKIIDFGEEYGKQHQCGHDFSGCCISKDYSEALKSWRKSKDSKEKA